MVVDLDLSIYDCVEVVKGVNGLMIGVGSLVMGINLICKYVNLKEFVGLVSVLVGLWNSYLSLVDLFVFLNNDGLFCGCIFVKYFDEDLFMDFYEKEWNIVYGVIDYDISDKILLFFVVFY